eukprot:413093_1
MFIKKKQILDENVMNINMYKNIISRFRVVTNMIDIHCTYDKYSWKQLKRVNENLAQQTVAHIIQIESCKQENKTLFNRILEYTSILLTQASDSTNIGVAIKKCKDAFVILNAVNIFQNEQQKEHDQYDLLIKEFRKVVRQLSKFI